MDIFSSSASRSYRRPVLSASLVFAAAVTVSATHGCSSQAESDPDGPLPFSGFAAGAAGTGPVASAGASAGGAPTGSGGAPSTSSAGEGNVTPGGLDNGTASSSGGAPISSGGAGGAGGAPPVPEVCEDAPPPFDPDWADATCESWAFEANACGEDWFANYCDVTCGRCVPEDGSGGPPMPPDCSGENLPDVQGGGQGFATRYWDCCQPACATQGGHKCQQDGTTTTGDNNSACVGGNSFACYDDAPRAISNCLSYGHVAKANPDCGGCYRIQFTGTGNSNQNDIGSKLIQGKQMIVKVTNTGSDVAGNQFDLMIPGGGVGLFNACSRQWNSNDLGAQYGGFLSVCTTGTHAQKKECVRQRCNIIPEGDARDGCLWFVDWFEIADNPNFTFEQTNCPF